MIEIIIENIFDSSINFNNKVIEQYANKIFNEYDHTVSKITFIIMNDFELSKLNIKFFNKNRFTDVITFNLEEEGKPIEGEIYISFERIKENAILYKQKIEEEFERIIIHGLLHLLGYDDKTKNEKEKMTKLENKYIGIYPNIIITK